MHACSMPPQHFEARAKDLEEQLEAEKLRSQQLEAELSDLQVEVGVLPFERGALRQSPLLVSGSCRRLAFGIQLVVA